MDKIFIVATNFVTGDDLATAQMGARFGRMDLASKLILLAVEPLAKELSAFPPDRVGICLGAGAGSLTTDLDFWQGRNATGGPSPTLFAFTLPSAAIGEVAIRHRLTGPNLCLVGPDNVLPEAADLLRRGEADVCLGLWCDAVSSALSDLIHSPPVARAGAVLLSRGGVRGREWTENDRDIESLCAASCGHAGENL